MCEVNNDLIVGNDALPHRRVWPRQFLANTFFDGDFLICQENCEIFISLVQIWWIVVWSSGHSMAVFVSYSYFFFCSFVFFEFCILVVNRSYSYFCGADNPIRSAYEVFVWLVFLVFFSGRAFLLLLLLSRKSYWRMCDQLLISFGNNFAWSSGVFKINGGFLWLYTHRSSDGESRNWTRQMALSTPTTEHMPTAPSDICVHASWIMTNDGPGEMFHLPC